MNGKKRLATPIKLINNMCIFHKYKPIKTYTYRDVSWDSVGSIITIIFYSCSKCHKVKQKDVYGRIELEDLLN